MECALKWTALIIMCVRDSVKEAGVVVGVPMGNANLLVAVVATP